MPSTHAETTTPPDDAPLVNTEDESPPLVDIGNEVPPLVDAPTRIVIISQVGLAELDMLVSEIFVVVPEPRDAARWRNLWGREGRK